MAERLKALLPEKAPRSGATIHALEVMPDHVHLFVESDPTFAPAHIAAQFKGYTSRVLRPEFPHLRSRLPTLWSRSYFASARSATSPRRPSSATSRRSGSVAVDAAHVQVPPLSEPVQAAALDAQLTKRAGCTTPRSTSADAWRMQRTSISYSTRPTS